MEQSNLFVGTDDGVDYGLGFIGTDKGVQRIKKVYVGNEDNEPVEMVSGRNLLPLAGKNHLTSYNSYNTNWEIAKTKVSTKINRSNTLNLSLQRNELSREPLASEVYTVSGYVAVNGKTPDDNIFLENRINTQIDIDSIISFEYNSSNGFFKTTLNNSSGWIFHARTNLVQNDELTIDKLQFEFGSTATPYTPAPEDIDF